MVSWLLTGIQEIDNEGSSCECQTNLDASSLGLMATTIIEKKMLQNKLRCQKMDNYTHFLLC